MICFSPLAPIVYQLFLKQRENTKKLMGFKGVNLPTRNSSAIEHSTTEIFFKIQTYIHKDDVYILT